jgi:hypothetical protein
VLLERIEQDVLIELVVEQRRDGPGLECTAVIRVV